MKRWLKVALPLALVLAGCGDDGDDSADVELESATTTESEETTTTTEADAEETTTTTERASDAEPGEIDPCTLLTDEEIEAAFEDSIEPTIESIDGDPSPRGSRARCTWRSDGGAQVRVFTGPYESILLDSEDVATFQAQATSRGWRVVNDLGALAFYDETASSGRNLHIGVDDDFMVSIEFVFIEPDVDVARELGEAALSRL